MVKSRTLTTPNYGKYVQATDTHSSLLGMQNGHFGSLAVPYRTKHSLTIKPSNCAS